MPDDETRGFTEKHIPLLASLVDEYLGEKEDCEEPPSKLIGMINDIRWHISKIENVRLFAFWAMQLEGVSDVDAIFCLAIQEIAEKWLENQEPRRTP